MEGQQIPQSFVLWFFTFVLTIIHFLIGIFPLVGYLVYVITPKTPESMHSTFFGIPLEDFAYPERWALIVAGLVFVAYAVFLHKIPNAVIWFHEYMIATLTSCYIIIIIFEQRPIIYPPWEENLPLYVKIAGLVIFRGMYMRFFFD